MFISSILRSSRQAINQSSRLARQGEYVDPNAAIAIMKKNQQMKQALRSSVVIEEELYGNFSSQFKHGTPSTITYAHLKEELWSPLRPNKI
ncbi:hypothetical protein K7432_015229 [Basidiobolus ranarum]|uniref:Uncharacterized protein n=1 Tax=Basidiobolus ranarum TaxID=34480 RepID=A0ABR2VNE8_9FUNG